MNKDNTERNRISGIDTQRYSYRARLLVQRGGLPRLAKRYLAQVFPSACPIEQKRVIHP